MKIWCKMQVITYSLLYIFSAIPEDLNGCATPEHNTKLKAEVEDKSKVCADNTNFTQQINKPGREVTLACLLH